MPDWPLSMSDESSACSERSYRALQCRDYGLAGPFTNLTKYKPQDWNEMIVTVANGVAIATVNGEKLDVETKVPPTGPIGLEGDRGQMEYRRIRIKTAQ